jgi:hypothetical protein
MASERASLTLINSIRLASTRELQPIGFKKRMSGVYTAELAPGYLGWLGLNEATHRGDGSVALGPVVGVRSHEVESLVVEMADRKARSYLPPTISTNIGYIMPQTSY